MADFSRLPKEDLDAAKKAGYIGIYFEQGVPILDRDLNLLQSMVADSVRSIVRSYIGDGVPQVDGGFQIKAIPADNDFLIAKGRCLVDGIEIELPEDLKYSAQKPEPPQLTKPTSVARTDTVYLDVALQIVESGLGGDDTLGNPGDVGMQTSVRVKRVWSVGVAEGAAPPQALEGHARHVLARIVRESNTAQITQTMIGDARRPILSLNEVELLCVQPTLRVGQEFSPPSAVGGQEVTIHGRNLDLEPVVVSFRGHEADKEFVAELTSISTNMLVVTVPPEHTGGQAEITVTTSADDVRRRRRVTSKQPFTVELEPPQLAPEGYMVPMSGPDGTTVTLTGQYLNLGEVVVTFGDKPAGLSSKTSAALTVVVPDGLPPGPVTVRVTTSGGSKDTPEPFRPAFAPTFDAQPFSTGSLLRGEVLTISGGHFLGLISLAFRPASGPDVPAPDAKPSNDNTITATVPNETPPGIYHVVITTDGGFRTSPNTIIVESG